MTREGADGPDGSRESGEAIVASTIDRITAGDISPEEGAAELADVAAREVDTTDEVLDALFERVTNERADVGVERRLSAISMLTEFAVQNPVYVDRTVPKLGEALDEPAVETTALRSLVRIEREEGAAIDPIRDAIVERLTNNPLPVRQNAVKILRQRATDDPGAVSDLTERLVDVVVSSEGMRVADSDLPDHEQSRLQDQTVAEERLRREIATILKTVAEADPAAVVSELDRLVALVEPAKTRDPLLKERVVEIVRTVGRSNPDAAMDHVETLYDVVESDVPPPSLKATAAETLATLADADLEAATAAARPAVPALGDLLDADDPAIRASAGSLLSFVAQRYPDEVSSLTGTLVERLDDDEMAVRASAVWTLAYVDTEPAREALRTVADEDPDADVRGLATELLSDGPGQ